MILTFAALFSFFSSPSAATGPGKPGTDAPAFTLTDQDGHPFSLAAQTGKKKIVLFFYPKDESPVCTKEACAFRDSYTAFTEAGALVVGINAAEPATHKKFAQHHQLPFTLLSDPENKVAALFGVKKVFGMSGRETFVIDLKGKIVFRFGSMLQGTKHVREALAVLKEPQH